MPSAGFQGIKRLLEQNRNVVDAAVETSAMNEIKSIGAKRPVIKSLVNFTRTSQIGIFFSETLGLRGYGSSQAPTTHL